VSYSTCCCFCWCDIAFACVWGVLFYHGPCSYVLFFFSSLTPVIFREERAPVSNDYGFNATQTPAEPAVPQMPKKGMQLGGKSKKMSMMDKLASEDNLAPLAPVSSAASAAANVAAPAPAAEENYPVMIIIEEKVIFS
jgi:hypothetical protein